MEISELQAEIDRQLEDYRIGKVRKRKDGKSVFYNIHYLAYINNKCKKRETNSLRCTR